MNSERPILSLEELEAFDTHAPAGPRRRFCCPLCGQGKSRDGSHRCLSLETATGLWRCFRCEASGQLREKWQDKSLGRSYRSTQAMRRAFSLEGDGSSRAATSTPFSPEDSASQPQTSGETSNSLECAMRRLSLLSGSRGEAYLGRRGLSLEVCLEANAKFAPSWLGRPAVVFPLYDAQGRLVAAQGRYTDGRDDPKTRTLGSKKQGVFLCGHFWEQVRRGAPLVIVEAPIDALSLAMCGFPALALCGKSGWPSWLPVKCAFKEVAIAFDADMAGEEGAAKLQPVLDSLGAKVRRVAPEEAKDWNEMLVRLGAESLGEWLCLHLLL